jgi:hypothetical protein
MEAVSFLSGRQVAAKLVKDAGYQLWITIATLMVVAAYVAAIRGSAWTYGFMACSIILNGFLALALCGERNEFRRWLTAYRGGKLD